MNIRELQQAIGVRADGLWGSNSRGSLLGAFTNPSAAAISPAQEKHYAARLGVSLGQLQAVARVESAGGGFDRGGRPRILFERHKFHKYTGGSWSVTEFSNPKGGGYRESSWGKLLGALATGDVDAAFMACSWGKFQVLGEWWDEFGFASPYALARATVEGEAAHYELLCRYIEHNHLKDEMASLSANPEACRAFARAYNGSRYADFAYHAKLARAMA